MRISSRWSGLVLLGVLAALALATPACDTPVTLVAPDGTILTISKSTSQVALNGTAVITVVGRRPDGRPLERVEIFFNATLGTIDAVVVTDAQGMAQANFRGDGRAGTATIKASIAGGAEAASVETEVRVGEAPESKPTLLVTVNPNNVPVGGNAEVTVIARQADGSPAPAGQPVILTTTLGSLSPQRPLTQADGTAEATLNAGTQAGTATVTAILGTSDPATASVTIRDAATAISVQANPQTIPRADSTVTLTAFVTNAQGQPIQGAPVTFQSEAGTLQTTGVVFTNTSGVATNQLTVRQQDVAAVNQFEVEASTPSGTGTLLRDTVTIRVQ
jgi:adhesin/invasin